MPRFILATLFLMHCVSTCLAGQVPGDVNFGLEVSPNNHAYKFRLLVDGTAITFPTGCVAPNTGLAQALTYGAIGQPQARLTIQASDCTQAQERWITLNGYLDYSSIYWYDVYINMLDHSFHC
jgi:hypothetical protein